MRRLGVADSSAMAALHARAFSTDDAWSPSSFEDLLALPHHFAVGIGDATALNGLLLARVIAGEGEILTLATHPDCRRRGYGLTLINGFAETADLPPITSWLLDVAADNHDALAFYQACGFQRDGLRRAYYRRGEDRRIDAILMSWHMSGQGHQ